jgi:hypothetical protein
MSRRTGRSIIGVCAVGMTGAALLLYTLGGAREGATAQALEEPGRFRLGAELGAERAGFSGLPLLYVFADPADPGWTGLAACLSSAWVEAELGSFTPVLIDERTDGATEATLRRRGLQVIARGLNGKLLGGLPHGASCEELILLLGAIRSSMIQSPEPSPIYAVLRRTPEPIEELLRRGERARAERLVDFLAEFEGEESPAVAAARERLGQ